MFSGGFKGFGGMNEQKQEPAKQVDNTEIPKTATTQEIRKAFRKKALKEHPDKGGDPQKFKKISEAYQILQNPQKRDLYDKYGMQGVQAGGPPGGGGFQDLFSFFGGGRGRKDTGPKKAKPKLINLQVTLEQVYMGCMKNITLKRYRVCQKCQGKGGKDVKICTKCKGKKVIQKLVQLGPGMYSQTQSQCPQCKGNGQIMNEADKCKECQGKKVLQKQRIIQVSIEVGCPHQHDYIFTGQSDQYPGVMAGDLYVRISLKKHKIYERRGADLTLKKKISLLQALSGVTLELTHLDGKKFIVSTAPGDIISHKQIKTVKGFGMPFYKDAMSHGNLYIQFDVQFPKKTIMNPQKSKLIRQILAGTFKKNQKHEKQNHQIHQSANKKKGIKQKQVKYLEEFNEHDLNKDPRGGQLHHNQYQEQGGNRTRAQCQQQ